MNPNLHTTQEVAIRLGLNPSRIRQLAPVLGIGRKVGRDWIFTDDEVELLRQRKTIPGRTPILKPTAD